MSLRHSAAALAAALMLCTVAAPPAVAASSSPSPGGSGLYGKGNPKYDGVWRQSLALLALHTSGVTPPRGAVGWLTGQQCSGGFFAAYRAHPKAPCGKSDLADVNATAAAVQALDAVGGHSRSVSAAVGWLKSVQNKDGGWGYNPGSPSDANSVAVVTGALAAAGEDVAKTLPRGGKGTSPYGALRAFQLGCDAGAGDRGAFAYQPDKKGRLMPNLDATAAAVLAGHGEGMAVRPVGKGDGTAAEPLRCGKGGRGETAATEHAAKNTAKGADGAAEAGTAYLAGVLKDHDWHLLTAVPGAKPQPDYGNTADAVLALAAGGHGKEARSTLGWLEKHARSWNKSSADPAALGQLILAAHATGTDPRSFGGADLVRRLGATGPQPQAGEKSEKKDSSSNILLVSLIGAGLATGIAVGFGTVLNSRRKKQSA